MRLPLWLRPRDTYFEEGSIPYLLLWWLSRDADTQSEEWVAAWLDARPGFPAAPHPTEWKTEIVERSRCVDRVNGYEMHISTWRIAFPAGHSLYAVAAYWELVKGKWVQLFAQTRTLPKQLDLLAALRSVHSRNPDTH